MSQQEHKPHKWDKEIRAFLDGKAIDIRNIVAGGKWVTKPNHVCNIAWFDNRSYEFRITPEKKTPGQVFYKACGGNCWKTQTEYLKDLYNRSATAVVEAYKNGELDYE